MKREAEMRTLRRIKSHLSTVSTNAWHYRLTAAIWKPKRVNRSKACSYYWFKLPLALLATPVALLAIVFLVLFAGIIAVGGWFTGHIPTFIGGEDQMEQFKSGYFPYKTWPSGKRRRILPWEVLATTCIPAGIYYISFVKPEVGKISGIVAVGLVLLGVILFVVSAGWNNSAIQNQRARVKAAWDRVCPPLTVVSSGEG